MSSLNNLSVIGGDLICIPQEVDLWAEVSGRGGPAGRSLKGHLSGTTPLSDMVLSGAGQTDKGAQPSGDLRAPSSKPAFPSSHLQLLAHHSDAKPPLCTACHG